MKATEPGALSQRSSSPDSRGAENEATSYPVFCETLDPNVATRFDFELDEAVRALAVQRGGISGVCNVSGTATRFHYPGGNCRESFTALDSGTINRQRQLVCGLALASGMPAGTMLPDIAKHLTSAGKRVHVVDSTSPVTSKLGALLSRDAFSCSDYFGDEHKSGEQVKGLRHENLEATSFASSSFDVVITSDVMQHMPDAIAAEREIVRILRPGGCFVFTVSFLPYAEHDIVRAYRDTDGQTRHVAEPLYFADRLHPTPGLLVYRFFSFADLRRRFEVLGCTLSVYRLWSKQLGIVGDDCYVLIVCKP